MPCVVCYQFVVVVVCSHGYVHVVGSIGKLVHESTLTSKHTLANNVHGSIVCYIYQVAF